MIKLLRKFRQNLINSGNNGKYLKYAFGEIVLVVIGILIALQINTLNETRKEIKNSSPLLEEFKTDPGRHTLESNYVTSRLESQTQIESLALHLVSYNKDQIDSFRQVFSALAISYL